MRECGWPRVREEIREEGFSFYVLPVQHCNWSSGALSVALARNKTRNGVRGVNSVTRDGLLFRCRIIDGESAVGQLALKGTPRHCKALQGIARHCKALSQKRSASLFCGCKIVRLECSAKQN